LEAAPELLSEQPQIHKLHTAGSRFSLLRTRVNTDFLKLYFLEIRIATKNNNNKKELLVQQEIS